MSKDKYDYELSELYEQIHPQGGEDTAPIPAPAPPQPITEPAPAGDVMTEAKGVRPATRAVQTAKKLTRQLRKDNLEAQASGETDKIVNVRSAVTKAQSKDLLGHYYSGMQRMVKTMDKDLKRVFGDNWQLQANSSEELAGLKGVFKQLRTGMNEVGHSIVKLDVGLTQRNLGLGPMRAKPVETPEETPEPISAPEPEASAPEPEAPAPEPVPAQQVGPALGQEHGLGEMPGPANVVVPPAVTDSQQAPVVATHPESYMQGK